MSILGMIFLVCLIAFFGRVTRVYYDDFTPPP